MIFVIDEVGHRLHVRDLGVPTMSDPRTHHPTAIVTGEVVGQCFRHGAPVARRIVATKRSAHLARRVFQLRRQAAELFELRDRGVEVGILENLAAVTLSPSTVNRSIPRHSASEPSRETPCAA